MSRKLIAVYVVAAVLVLAAARWQPIVLPTPHSVVMFGPGTYELDKIPLMPNVTLRGVGVETMIMLDNPHGSHIRDSYLFLAPNIVEILPPEATP